MGQNTKQEALRLASAAANVAFFQLRRPGPEIVIEDTIIHGASALRRRVDLPWLIAGSLTIGAGKPDLLLVSYNPQILTASRLESHDEVVLGYLKTVSRARFETIRERTGRTSGQLERQLDQYVDVGAVFEKSGVFRLTPCWRNILPEVISVEAKVSNWRKAMHQAGRNRLFAHESFVALPETVALRTDTGAALREMGIGLLSICAKEVDIVHSARRRQPVIWYYYYRLALTVARHLGGEIGL